MLRRGGEPKREGNGDPGGYQRQVYWYPSRKGRAEGKGREILIATRGVNPPRLAADSSGLTDESCKVLRIFSMRQELFVSDDVNNCVAVYNRRALENRQ